MKLTKVLLIVMNVYFGIHCLIGTLRDHSVILLVMLVVFCGNVYIISKYYK